MTSTLEEMMKAIAAAEPPEWLLIAPDGRVYRGPNPLTLAAVAMPPPPFGVDLAMLSTQEGA